MDFPMGIWYNETVEKKKESITTALLLRTLRFECC